MKKFWSIFTFTYKETIRNKALIISTIITLIVMLGFFNMDKIVILADQMVYIEGNDSIYLGRDSFSKAKKIFAEYLETKKKSVQ